MKKTVISLIVILCAIFNGSAAGKWEDGISAADSLCRVHEYIKAGKQLDAALASSVTGKQRAEVLWRLSRVCLMQGEALTSKEDRRALYAKGLDFASKAIAEDKTSPEAYMWHCASIGRECQTHNLMSQASKVPAMRSDLEMILNKLGRTDFSEAWQALAELYYHHPFLSTDAAINYARAAACCSHDEDTHGYICVFLAKMLYDRNWSAAKRASVFAENAQSFSKQAPNTEKYACYDGAPEVNRKSVWSKAPLSSISDRQEARAILDYAIARYDKSPSAVRNDAEYKNMLKLKEEWK